MNWTLLLKELGAGRTVALATLATRDGSAPRLPGAKLVLAQDGRQQGSIGGGRLEALTLDACRRVLAGAPAELLPFDLTSPDPNADMICGGRVEVLVERIDPSQRPLFDSASRGDALAWLVDITHPDAPTRRLIAADGPDAHFVYRDSSDSAKPGVRSSALRRVAGIVEADGRRYLVDPLAGQSVVLLCGGGHVSLAVAGLAHGVGFAVDVVDDRPEFADSLRFPQARNVRVLPDFAGVCLNATPDYFIVICTRGHAYDKAVLAQALATSARYIGMIGSRRKRTALYDSLLAEGFTVADLARVHCPIGLAIGAETPEEIAVSIVAQLIAARSGCQP